MLRSLSPAPLTPLRRLPRPRLAPVRSPCDTRAYVYASPAACTWPMHVYRYVHEATKRATFRRACFLRVSAPVGQTNRPAPTSSNQPVRRPLRLRARSLVPLVLSLSENSLSFFPSRETDPLAPSSLVFFPFDLGVAIARLHQISCVQVTKERADSFKGVANQAITTRLLRLP